MELFTAVWMRAFRECWNNDLELVNTLKKIDFHSTIAYGFDGEEQPRGFIRVEDGKVIEAGLYEEQPLNWDLRSTRISWNKWLKTPPSMAGLGLAYASRKLKIEIGDYISMIKDPRMAKPFVRSFLVMSQIKITS